MRSIVLTFFLATVAIAQAPEAQRAFDKGVKAYSSAQYTQAVDYFKQAIQKKPDWVEAHLCLGATYSLEYYESVPENPPDWGRADAAAEAAFKKALEISPANVIAFSGLGNLAYLRTIHLKPEQQAKLLDQSGGWYQKVIAADPQNRDGYYVLGFADWMRAYQQYRDTRVRLGIPPAGPIRNVKTRQDLRSRIGPIYEDAIRQLKRALEIDPVFIDALAYLSLCIRQSADLADTAGERTISIRQADEYVDRAARLHKSQTVSTWKPRAQLPIGMDWIILPPAPLPPDPNTK